MFRLMLVVLLALVAVAGLTAVSAQEATPAPTSTITIHFVRDGQPLEVNTKHPAVIADGVQCPFVVIPESERLSSYTQVWGGGSPTFPTECTKGPPTTIRFEFEMGFESLAVDVLWTGSDIDVNLEVPGPPTDLPPTGAAPAEDTGEPRWFGLGLMAAGLIAASLGAMTRRLGRR